MKTLTSILILLLGLITLSCNRDDSNYLTEFKEGEYEGIFFRTQPNAFYEPSNVNLTLKDGNFEGFSSKNEYPMICEGIYEIGENEIIFNDHCSWTADFDWTYILNRSFTFEVIDGKLYLIKDYENGIIDTYQLSIIR